MRHILIMIILAGLMIPVDTIAQKVYKSGDKFILDLTVKAGMPKGSQTGVSKTVVYDKATPTESTVIAANKNDEEINATVYQKLEIAPQDVNSDGSMSASALAMRWTDAFAACKRMSYNEGDWRLPTQREMMLIWTFRPALNKLGITALVDNVDSGGYQNSDYWTGTEGSVGTASMLIYYIGDMPNASKSRCCRVRCVREVK